MDAATAAACDAWADQLAAQAPPLTAEQAEAAARILAAYADDTEGADVAAAV